MVLDLELYNRALGGAETGNDPYARGQTDSSMRAAAAGEYQLTATTAEDLVEKYGDEYQGLKGMSGEAILEKVALDTQLQQALQKTLVKDQKQTIRNLGGDPEDSNSHALLHRFGTGTVRGYIDGTLDMNALPEGDKVYDQSPAQYLNKMQVAGGEPQEVPAAPMQEPVNLLQRPTATPEPAPAGRPGGFGRFMNTLLPGQPMGPDREWAGLSKRKQRKVVKLNEKLEDKKWTAAHPKKAARAKRKLGYLSALDEAGKDDGRIGVSERMEAQKAHLPKKAKAMDWLLSAPLAATGMGPLVAGAGAATKIYGDISEKPKMEKAGDVMMHYGGRGSVLGRLPGLF